MSNSFTWTGNGATTSTSDPNNWIDQGGNPGVPGAGDSVDFPNQAIGVPADQFIFSDVISGGLDVASVSIEGLVDDLSGNLQVSGNLTVSTPNLVNNFGAYYGLTLAQGVTGTVGGDLDVVQPAFDPNAGETTFGVLINGASLTVNGNVNLGGAAAPNGQVFLENGAQLQIGGNLNINGDLQAVESVADFEIWNSTVTLANGQSVNVDGTLDLIGAAAALVTNQSLNIGDAGFGSISLQEGATFTTVGDLVLGRGQGNSGVVTVQDGTLNVSGNLILGSNGASASLRTDDGNDAATPSVINVFGNVVAGAGENSFATIELAGFATLDIEAGGSLDLAQAVGSTGVLTLESSNTTVETTSTITVGDAGEGEINLDGNGASLDTPQDLVLAAQSTATGFVYLAADSNLTVGGALDVGQSGAGTVTFVGGGTIESDSAVLGELAGGSGSVFVTGAGSVWTVSTDLMVGDAGTGDLTISEGGQVSSQKGEIGTGSSDQGAVDVNGPGSSWSISDNLQIGVQGGAGNPSLTISNQASVTTADPNSYDTLWSGSLTLEIGGQLSEAYLDMHNAATLTIESGATLTENGGSIEPGLINAVGGLGGNGTIIIDDATLASQNNYTFVGILTTGGGAGKGTLTASDGATINSFGTGLGEYVGDTGTLTLTGPGTTWTDTGSTSVDANTAGFNVGVAGTGSLTIEDGAVLSNPLAYVKIGQNAGTVGVATVTGTGSILGAGGLLRVGDSGKGTLTLEAGGMAQVGSVEVGDFVGAVGEIDIDAGGTLTTNSASTIDVGPQLGGTVVAGFFDIGVFGQGTVNVDAGTLNVGSDLIVGDDGTGNLTIGAGGTASAQSVQVGAAGTITLNVGGTLTATAEQIDAGGQIILAGGTNDPPDAITIEAGGRISGYGSIIGSVVNNGLLEAVGGTLAVSGALTGIGKITVDAGADLNLDGSVGSSQTVALGGTTLMLADPSDFAGTITGLAVGDIIDLTTAGFSAGGSAKLEANNVLQIIENGQTYHLQLDPAQSFGGDAFKLTADAVGSGTDVTVAAAAVSQPVVAGPAALALTQGNAGAISGVSISEINSVPGEMFAVTVSDTSGLLSASGPGVGGAGTKSLSVSGSLAQVNTDLATLSDIDAVAGSDSILVSVEDGFDNVASTAIAATVAPLAPVAAAPATLALTQGNAGAVSGVSISEIDSVPGETFAVTVTDTNGLLSASGPGVGGAGTTSLTISGALAQVNADLATLSDIDAVAGSDSILVSVEDGFDNVACTAIAATVAPLAPVAAASATLALTQGNAGVISGVSISEINSVPGETFAVTVTDTNGLLSASGPGVGGAGTKSLSVSGSLAQVNADLATLSDTDAVAGSDPILVTVKDGFNNSASASIATTVTAVTSADQKFLNALYEDILDRPIDSTGLAAFEAQLSAGATDARVAREVVTSPEAYADLVTSWYHEFLGRAPDSVGLSTSVQALSSGSTEEQVQSTILGSAEFFRDAGGTNAGYVQALFQDVLGRRPSAGELNVWVQQIAALEWTRSAATARSEVALEILTSPEHVSDEVTGWFESYLGRAPTLAELISFAGIVWTAGDQTAIAAILGSPEFVQNAPTAFIWKSPVSGSIANASAWNTGVVPGSTADVHLSVAGTYTVTSTANVVVNSLSIVSGATLAVAAGEFSAVAGSGSGVIAGKIEVADGATFAVGGSVDNTGTIGLNATGDATKLDIDGAVTLGGNGSVVLSDNARNVIAGDAVDGGTLTNSHNTISGAGRIGNNGDSKLTFINAGTVDADEFGNSLTIDTGNTITNKGLLEATAGGSLTIDDNVNNGGGVIAANLGNVKVAGALSGAGKVEIFSGGSLTLGSSAADGAIFENNAGSLLSSLVLQDAQGFSGTVAGMASGDRIDLANFLSADTSITKITGTGAAGTTTNVTLTDTDPGGPALSVTLHLMNQFANQFGTSASDYSLKSDQTASNGTLFQLAAHR